MFSFRRDVLPVPAPEMAPVLPAPDITAPPAAIAGVIPRASRPDLFVLVGPSGAGKTTAVAKAVERGEFAAWQISATDEIRRILLGDRNNHTQNDRVAAVFRDVLATLLRHGLTAVADATHLRREHRMATAEVGLRVGAQVVYWVVDRPLEDKLRDASWRRDVRFRDGDNLVSRDHRRMVEALPAILAGDGLPGIVIRDARRIPDL